MKKLFMILFLITANFIVARVQELTSPIDVTAQVHEKQVVTLVIEFDEKTKNQTASSINIFMPPMKEKKVDKIKLNANFDVYFLKNDTLVDILESKQLELSFSKEGKKQLIIAKSVNIGGLNLTLNYAFNEKKELKTLINNGKKYSNNIILEAITSASTISGVYVDTSVDIVPVIRSVPIK